MNVNRSQSSLIRFVFLLLFLNICDGQDMLLGERNESAEYLNTQNTNHIIISQDDSTTENNLKNITTEKSLMNKSTNIIIANKNYEKINETQNTEHPSPKIYTSLYEKPITSSNVTYIYASNALKLIEISNDTEKNVLSNVTYVYPTPIINNVSSANNNTQLFNNSKYQYADKSYNRSDTNNELDPKERLEIHLENPTMLINETIEHDKTQDTTPKVIMIRNSKNKNIIPHTEVNRIRRRFSSLGNKRYNKNIKSRIKLISKPLSTVEKNITFTQLQQNKTINDNILVDSNNITSHSEKPIALKNKNKTESTISATFDYGSSLVLSLENNTQKISGDINQNKIANIPDYKHTFTEVNNNDMIQFTLEDAIISSASEKHEVYLTSPKYLQYHSEILDVKINNEINKNMTESPKKTKSKKNIVIVKKNQIINDKSLDTKNQVSKRMYNDNYQSQHETESKKISSKRPDILNSQKERLHEFSGTTPLPVWLEFIPKTMPMLKGLSYNTYSNDETQLSGYYNILQSYIPAPQSTPSTASNGLLIIGPIPKSYPTQYKSEPYMYQMNLPIE